MKRTLACVIWMAIVACSQRNPTAEEVKGTWYAADGAIFDLVEEERFAVIDLPARALDFRKSESTRLSGSGVWSIGADDGVSGRRVRFVMQERSDGGPVTLFYLFVSGSGESMELYTFLGDPDSTPRFVFERRH